MKHIKQDFSLKAWVKAPGVTWGAFIEYGHVAYQIKADVCSKRVANYLPTETPLTQGEGSKVQTIYLCESIVMLHMKLKGIEHRALSKQICCHYTNDPWVIFFFLF